jgi:hypothetical protein
MNRRTIFLGGILWAAAAAADEPPRKRPVRTSATVEVIDDARHVEDIISRMRTQQQAQQQPQQQPAERAPGAPPVETRKPAPVSTARSERPPLPSEGPADDRRHPKAGADRRDRRLERERTNLDRHRR